MNPISMADWYGKRGGGSNFTPTNTLPFDYFDNDMCGKKVGRKERP